MDYTMICGEPNDNIIGAKIDFLQSVQELLESDEDWRPHGSLQMQVVVYDNELIFTFAQAFVKGRLYAI